ncbi:cytochrome c [Flavobacteriaceae bacterium]|jgi:mono/diheme cytochrome c family protein|nr:cytochrome c [Flavobacteriaceae bacterium]MDA9183961.1 cytochrome c [Flavobacteriaceae bacterium]MDA9245117.1 cytochrome c [Flavobacteriaceae bacterium]MDB2673123.1 cytochrome c [Flavobacteriaceae bacterium]MDB4113259.1 cytochrome c [Flavobacteriaceae bacterium]
MKGISLFLIGSFTGLSLFLYQQKPLAQSIADGEEIYIDFCMQCHMTNGEGVPGAFPPLANSDYLLDIEKTIYALKFGLKGPITVNGKAYNSVMASQGLDDEEIADVMNYILRNWGNETEEVITEEKVTSVLK